MTPYILLMVISLVGFLIAGYIYYQKIYQKPLACPFNFECDKVIYSNYSKFLGIPVELLGLFYYGVTLAIYTALLIWPHLIPVSVVFLTLVVSLFAFLFSIYLTVIQTLVLRQWCSWCLFSAILCVMLFTIASYTISPELVILLLERAYSGTLGMHMFGVVLGLGGATIADLLFFKFLKDFTISASEADVLHTVSNVIWLGIAILLVSGLGLFLPAMNEYSHSSKFLLKMVVVAVIIINGTLLNLFVSPKLVTIAFSKGLDTQTASVERLRKIAFAFGSISMVSWYSAFLLGMTRSIPLPFSLLLSIYATLLICAVTGSQIIERMLANRAKSTI